MNLIMGIKQKATELCKATKNLVRPPEVRVPTIVVKTNLGKITFLCPGKRSERRARTLLRKEPETIEWINSFCETDVVWDIGANVGVYSLYAALKGLSVLAFEPSPSNYYLLSKNIEINMMDDRISPYCIAFSDKTELGILNMANTEFGGALNSFGEALDWQGNAFTASLRQAAVGFTLDEFAIQFGPPFPNHIKIDVDGIEDKIIKGARNTLADTRLKSVLVELDTNRKGYCKGVTDVLESSGLNLFKKAHAPEFDNGEFASVYNHIFVRSGVDLAIQKPSVMP